MKFVISSKSWYIRFMINCYSHATTIFKSNKLQTLKTEYELLLKNCKNRLRIFFLTVQIKNKKLGKHIGYYFSK